MLSARTSAEVGRAESGHVGSCFGAVVTTLRRKMCYAVHALVASTHDEIKVTLWQNNRLR